MKIFKCVIMSNSIRKDFSQIKYRKILITNFFQSIAKSFLIEANLNNAKNTGKREVQVKTNGYYFHTRYTEA